MYVTHMGMYTVYNLQNRKYFVKYYLNVLPSLDS